MLRGRVYRFDFDSVFLDFPDSGEAAGERRAVIVSCNSLNTIFDTVIIAPTTSSNVDKHSEDSQHVLLTPSKNITGIDTKCLVQLHLLYSVNFNRLDEVGEDVGSIGDQRILDEIAIAGGWSLWFQTMSFLS